MKHFIYVLPVFLFFAVSGANSATNNEKSVEVDQAKVDKWNQFSAQLTSLHKKLTSTQSVRKEVKLGGYSGEFFNKKSFYVEESFYSKKENRLISRVKWEKDKPESIHVLEVFFYDSKGRIDRDYLVAYLPWARNAPIQALVNLHSYNNGLHGFRQFDASGERVYEQCSGSLNGQLVDISLESYEIGSPNTDKKEYRKCFSQASRTVGKYITPQ